MFPFELLLLIFSVDTEFLRKVKRKCSCSINLSFWLFKAFLSISLNRAEKTLLGKSYDVSKVLSEIAVHAHLYLLLISV